MWRFVIDNVNFLGLYVWISHHLGHLLYTKKLPDLPP